MNSSESRRRHESPQVGRGERPRETPHQERPLETPPQEGAGETPHQEGAVELRSAGGPHGVARRGFIASVSYALDGLLRTLLTQRNMKIHWVSGLAVMLVGMALSLDVAARASLIFCVFVVLTMETLNTAFEAFVDLHVRQYAKTAMVAKDAAAAAVLLLAVAAIVVFSDITFHQWHMVERSVPVIIRTVALGVPLLGIVTLILTIRRSVGWLVLLGGLAFVPLSVLAWYSRDEVFSLGAASFVLGALAARLFEPRLRIS